MHIFISHWSEEKSLASGLATWIENLAKGTKCFCSSRPTDIVPGDEWFRKIISDARRSDLALFMLSPDSINREWIHFEAGLIAGSTTRKITKAIIPVLYGGTTPDRVASTLSQSQALRLNSPAEFDAAINHYFPKIDSNAPHHENFTATLNQSANRIMRLGYFAGFEPGAVHSEAGYKDFKLESDNVVIDKHTVDGEIASIRVFFTPRHLDEKRRWKFGIGLLGDVPDDLLFHASCENNISTWTLYPSHIRGEARTYNIPAALEWDKPCYMSIWFRDHGNEMAVAAVDSDGQKIRIPGKAGNGFWRLIKKDWSKAKINLWNDHQNHPMQVDARWEVDRVVRTKEDVS